MYGFRSPVVWQSAPWHVRSTTSRTAAQVASALAPVAPPQLSGMPPMPPVPLPVPPVPVGLSPAGAQAARRAVRENVRAMTDALLFMDIRSSLERTGSKGKGPSLSGRALTIGQ